MAAVAIRTHQTQLPATPGHHHQTSSHHGHLRPTATKCGHELHPSASRHVPFCPNCRSSRASSALRIAINDFVAHGDVHMPADLRDLGWSLAKKRYEVAKTANDTLRTWNQRRWEREDEWDAAHEPYRRYRNSSTTVYDGPGECPACTNLIACYPTRVQAQLSEKHIAWWEKQRKKDTSRPQTQVPAKKSSHPLEKNRRHEPIAAANGLMRKIIHGHRQRVQETDRMTREWTTKNKLESVYRQKQNIDRFVPIDYTQLIVPLPAMLARRTFIEAKEDRLYKRGRKLATRLGPTPLRQSTCASDEPFDEGWILAHSHIISPEKMSRLVKEVRREVGYLYFVGPKRRLEEWHKEFLCSNLRLVTRIWKPQSSTAEDSDSSDSDDDSDSEMSEEGQSDAEIEGKGREPVILDGEDEGQTCLSEEMKKD